MPRRVIRRRRALRGLGDFESEYYTGAPDDTGEVLPPSPGVFENFKNQFFSALQEFDNAVSTLSLRQQQLAAIQSSAVDAADIAAVQSEYNKISAVNATIQSAQSVVNEISSWIATIRGTFGLNAIRRGLGVLPMVAIPWGLIGVITAATAAIAGVIYSSGSLIDRLTLKAWNDENIRLSQEGKPPLPRPEMVSGGSLFGELSSMAKVAIFGFAAWVLLPVLAEKMRK